MKTDIVNKRINSLAGLKIFALIAIFVWHEGLIPKFNVDLGARGCEFFFVCSGFLVMYNYFNKTVEPTWENSFKYYLKKLVQMWPLHFICLIYAFILNIGSFSLSYVWQALLNALLLHSWSNNLEVSTGFNGVSWYIASLLFCYFLSPMLISVIKKAKNKFVLFIIVTAARFFIEYISVNYPDNVFCLSVHTNPIVRCLEFIMGMIFAVFFIEKRFVIKNRILSTATEIICIIALCLICYFGQNYLYRAVYVVFFCIMVYVFSFENGLLSGLLSSKLMVNLSKIQFEFYIIHKLVITTVELLFVKLLHFEYSWMASGYKWIIISLLTFVLTGVIAFIYKKLFSKTFEKTTKKGVNLLTKSLFNSVIFREV